MTGLTNRAALRNLIYREVKNPNNKLSLLIIDVDNFKAINDQYGRERGDDILKTLAALFRRNVREKDIIIRWGGDEVLIILPKTSIENAQIMAENQTGH